MQSPEGVSLCQKSAVVMPPVDDRTSRASDGTLDWRPIKAMDCRAQHNQHQHCATQNEDQFVLSHFSVAALFHMNASVAIDPKELAGLVPCAECDVDAGLGVVGSFLELPHDMSHVVGMAWTMGVH